MKNILFLHASAELYGSDYVLLNLLKSLDRKEFTPYTILPFDGPLCNELKKINVNLFIHDLPVLRRQLFSPYGLIKFSYSFIKSFFYLIYFIYKYKIDIIHTNTSAVWIGGVVAKLIGKKHIWQVMELIEKPYIVALLLSKIVGIFSDKVFTISEAVKTHFLIHNAKRESKFQTLYHGVDLMDYQWTQNKRDQIRKKIGVPADTFVVGMAGRINQWKGQDIFVESIPIILKQAKKKIYFLILGSCFAGQEHYEDDLKKKILSLSIQDNISFMGFQNNFSDWLSAMDIFILPSKLPEPNATVTLAAMAMKLPVIGTNIGGTKESIIDGQTGFLIEPANSRLLAEKILDIADMDKKDIIQMGEAGYDRVIKVFSIDNYCQTIVTAYNL